jgi:hypothetical protein
MSFCMSRMSNHASSGRVQDERCAGLEHRRADRAARHDVERELGVDALADGEQQPLREREHLDGEADVDRELERLPVAAVADPRRRAEFAQQRLDAGVRARVAADHDRERPRLHLGHASRHGRVEHRRLVRAHARVQAAAHAGADGAHVDPRLAGDEAGEDPVPAGGGRIERAVVRQRREDDVDGVGHSARRVPASGNATGLFLGRCCGVASSRARDRAGRGRVSQRGAHLLRRASSWAQGSRSIQLPGTNGFETCQPARRCRRLTSRGCGLHDMCVERWKRASSPAAMPAASRVRMMSAIGLDAPMERRRLRRVGRDGRGRGGPARQRRRALDRAGRDVAIRRRPRGVPRTPATAAARAALRRWRG